MSDWAAALLGQHRVSSSRLPVGPRSARAEDSGLMTGSALLDAAGRRRSPATMPGFHCGRPPGNKGLQYPADPPTVEEIVAVMRCAGDSAHGLRTLGAGCTALARRSTHHRGAERRRERPRCRSRKHPYPPGQERQATRARHGCLGVAQLSVWFAVRVDMRVGALLCVIDGPTQGRPWSATAARATLRELAVAAGVRRRFAPHRLRHAHAVEMAREGIPLNVIQRQLGHANLRITSIYLQGHR
jgi:hypothetical protein